jgi:hypothetical protein
MNSNPGRAIARPASTPDQDAPDASRPTFAQNYPSLYRFLSEDRENENFHSTGAITVFWESGVFKVNLNDRPLGKSCFVSHTELGGAFLIADRGIRSGSLRWRVNRKYRASAARVNG